MIVLNTQHGETIASYLNGETRYLYMAGWREEMMKLHKSAVSGNCGTNYYHVYDGLVCRARQSQLHMAQHFAAMYPDAVIVCTGEIMPLN